MSDADNRAMGLAVALCNRLNGELRLRRKKKRNWQPPSRIVCVAGDKGVIDFLLPDADLGPARNFGDAYAMFNGLRWIPFVPTIQYDSAFAFITPTSSFPGEDEKTSPDAPCYATCPSTGSASEWRKQWADTIYAKHTIVLDNMTGVQSRILEAGVKTVRTFNHHEQEDYNYSCGALPEADYCCTTESINTSNSHYCSTTITPDEILNAFGAGTAGYAKLSALVAGITGITMGNEGGDITGYYHAYNVGPLGPQECPTPSEDHSKGSAEDGIVIGASPGPRVNPDSNSRHIFAKGSLITDPNPGSGFFGVRKSDNVQISLPEPVGLTYYPDVYYAWAIADRADAYGASAPSILMVNL